MSAVRFFLNDPKGYYLPGETVQGTFICSFNGDKNVRGITLKLKGTEHTQWTRTVQRRNSEGRMVSHTETCIGNNDFLNVAISVAGEGTISSGRREYPFSFLLPSHLPSTFQHRNGWIGYKLKGVVDRPWKTDYEASAFLIVRSLINLNTLSPHLKQPIRGTDEKYVCCFCCASGPVTMNFHLDRSAFVAGEVVRPTIEVTNHSNSNVDNLTVKILMTYHFRTETHPESREDTELLASATESGVGAHGERTYNLALEIPSTSDIPNFSLCKLFQVSYHIIACAEFGCHIDLEVKDSLTLGHIPYLDHAGQDVRYVVTGMPMPQPMPQPMPLSPITVPPPPTNPHFPMPTAPPPMGFTPPEHVAPPSYDEAIGEKSKY